MYTNEVMREEGTPGWQDTLETNQDEGQGELKLKMRHKKTLTVKLKQEVTDYMQWQDPNTLKVGTEGHQMNARWMLQYKNTRGVHTKRNPKQNTNGNKQELQQRAKT